MEWRVAARSTSVDSSSYCGHHQKSIGTGKKGGGGGRRMGSRERKALSADDMAEGGGEGGGRVAWNIFYLFWQRDLLLSAVSDFPRLIIQTTWSFPTKGKEKQGDEVKDFFFAKNRQRALSHTKKEIKRKKILAISVSDTFYFSEFQRKEKGETLKTEPNSIFLHPSFPLEREGEGEKKTIYEKKYWHFPEKSGAFPFFHSFFPAL